ncbi:hypothetical protein QR685DRAFT_536160 [Neurospora intermedia]|uniref:Secreted protein n=1 Tax=Neurospora intermedia TaxID=5142 RepID=A0ABR3D0T6_NEUIN
MVGMHHVIGQLMRRWLGFLALFVCTLAMAGLFRPHRRATSFSSSSTLFPALLSTFTDRRSFFESDGTQDPTY